jgi:hypothetical protein
MGYRHTICIISTLVKYLYCYSLKTKLLDRRFFPSDRAAVRGHDRRIADREGAPVRHTHVLAFLAAGAVAVQPCLAAGIAGEASPVRVATGAFAGVKLAMPLGRGRSRPPHLRLEVAPSYALVDARSGAALGTRTEAGLELGLRRDGALDLSIAGRSAADLKPRLGFKGSTGYIVVGGALLLVALLAAVASAQPKPGPRPGDFGP